jgi:hypothetical protein
MYLPQFSFAPYPNKYRNIGIAAGIPDFSPLPLSTESVSSDQWRKALAHIPFVAFDNVVSPLPSHPY